MMPQVVSDYRDYVKSFFGEVAHLDNADWSGFNAQAIPGDFYPLDYNTQVFRDVSPLIENYANSHQLQTVYAKNIADVGIVTIPETDWEEQKAANQVQTTSAPAATTVQTLTPAAAAVDDGLLFGYPKEYVVIGGVAAAALALWLAS